MQIYALNNMADIVSTRNAERSVDYQCRECGSIVRLRGGPLKQRHFYHIQHPAHCTLHQKGLPHIQLQQHLKDLFENHNCSLEHPFPEVQRIADVCVHDLKLIFEIQCSPISAQEVLQRVRDYGDCGYSVIWILHDKQFNRRQFSQTELFLIEYPHYFSNMNPEGKGAIYDQISVLTESGKRKKLSQHTILLNKIYSLTKDTIDTLPPFLQERKRRCPLYFAGELCSTLLSDPSSNAVIYVKNNFRNPEALISKILRLWRGFCHFLLEITCQ